MLLVASKLQCSVARICTRTASGTSTRGDDDGTSRSSTRSIFARRQSLRGGRSTYDSPPGRYRSARRHGGGAMPTVMAYHDVKDKDHWLASPRREQFFGPLGVTNIRTFVDPENPTRVGLVMDVSDMDAVMAAMDTEAAAEALAHDGVLPETLVILVEA